MRQEAMLVQIDGSHHPWLEDRGPKLRPLIAGDEAVLRAVEDTWGYLVSLERLVRQRCDCSAAIALFRPLRFRRMTSRCCCRHARQLRLMCMGFAQ